MLAAGVSLVSWILVIVFGRLTAYVFFECESMPRGSFGYVFAECESEMRGVNELMEEEVTEEVVEEEATGEAPAPEEPPAESAAPEEPQ